MAKTHGSRTVRRAAGTSHTPEGPSGWRPRPELLAAVLLAVATLAVFGHVCTNDFFNLDDYEYILNNPHARNLNLQTIGWALTTFHSGNWHPLTWLSLQLDYQLYGPVPGGFHLTNLLLHVANTLLLFFVWRRLTGAVWRSAWVAALFALHPLHVESVAWIAERKDVLSTLFWMLTLLAYARYVERPSVVRYLLMVLAFALGLTAKSMLVTLPCVLWLLDYWPLGRWQPGRRRRVIAEKIPLLLLAAAVSVLVVKAQSAGKLVTSLEEVSFPNRVGNALVAYVRYIGMTLWPYDLAVYYPHPRDRLPLWVVVGSGLLLAGLTVLVLWNARRRPYLPVGWFWYLGMLVPVIGLVQVATQALADRYTYVPLIGLFLIAAWGLPELATRLRYPEVVLAPLAVILLAIYGLAAWVQVGFWHDSITLWKHTLEVTQENYVAHSNLGVALRKEGRMKEALDEFAEAVRLRPDLPGMQNAVGVGLLDRGQAGEAIGHFQEARRLDPTDARTYAYLGTAYLRKGQTDEAVRYFTEALQRDGELTNAHVGLGIALWHKGKLEEAEHHLTTAVALDPNGPATASTHYRLGEMLEAQGRLTDALPHYAEAVRLQPDNVQYQSTLTRARRE